MKELKKISNYSNWNAKSKIKPEFKKQKQCLMSS